MSTIPQPGDLYLDSLTKHILTIESVQNIKPPFTPHVHLITFSRIMLTLSEPGLKLSFAGFSDHIGTDTDGQTIGLTNTLDKLISYRDPLNGQRFVPCGTPVDYMKNMVKSIEWPEGTCGHIIKKAIIENERLTPPVTRADIMAMSPADYVAYLKSYTSMQGAVIANSPEEADKCLGPVPIGLKRVYKTNSLGVYKFAYQETYINCIDPPITGEPKPIKFREFL